MVSGPHTEHIVTGWGLHSHCLKADVRKHNEKKEQSLCGLIQHHTFGCGSLVMITFVQVYKYFSLGKSCIANTSLSVEIADNHI